MMAMGQDPTESGSLAVSIRHAGDSAFLVEFGEHLSEQSNDAALAFERIVRVRRIPAIVETVPTGRSVLVKFDPLVSPFRAVRSALAELLDGIDWSRRKPMPGKHRWTIPVRYGGEHGSDLDDVARALGLSVDRTIEDHASSRLRIMMIGFAPGALYCGMHDARWALPRLPCAKPMVPAGSVSVAVRQTVIYSLPNPTGWRPIGQTPFRSFDPNRVPPSLVRAGDEIRFRAVSETEFLRLGDRALAGELVAEREEIP
ncbi:MAG: allophanate hydrolase subunit 1 [Alphaproteobacteria bacterium]|nr:allophanate hydrolase subunit 1 [Alphaproteobacteria bacterium]